MIEKSILKKFMESREILWLDEMIKFPTQNSASAQLRGLFLGPNCTDE